jgi:hypothetical protein
MNVITGTSLIVLQTVARVALGLRPVWSDPDRVGRLLGIVMLILAVMMFLMGCWQLFRSKTP